MEMRKMFANELEKLMNENENIVLLNADLAKPNGFGDFSSKFPERAINVGIAEQNMASIAAGMSSYGFIPFICSFTPFATRRICDQIAISICYAKQNVKIIGSDPGISAEYNGGTHMSFEDIGVLRSIPNIVIFEPVDNAQLKNLLPQIIDYKGPVYIRMFRKSMPDIFDDNETFNLFKAKKIKDGKDVSIFCSGIMVDETLKANKKLEEMGINAEIINIHTIKPIDEESIISSVQKTKAAVTVENHNIIGGLRSAVSEVICENYPVPVRSVGVRDTFGQVGKMPYLKEVYKMTEKDIISAVVAALEAKED
ncbi:MAG: transketolase family protein [Clostridia bacterium]|nr:transketolase family protein [Clostridia bacterium]MBR2735565.1 transketolase family protein [Clostridia bacterium]